VTRESMQLWDFRFSRWWLWI